MTPEQIEAKALEFYPDTEFVQYTNALARAAFIKGCQYAATPSAIHRPAESPDAGREHPLAGVIIGLDDAADEYSVGLSSRDAFIAGADWHKEQFPAPPLPDTNAGDIPAGKEAQVKQASADYVSRNKLGVSTIGMRSGFEHGAAWAFTRFPTPADPGSQVEAVDLLKWIAEIDLVYLEDKKGWFGKTNWKHDGVNHEQLATLYKQSL